MDTQTFRLTPGTPHDRDVAGLEMMLLFSKADYIEVAGRRRELLRCSRFGGKGTTKWGLDGRGSLDRW